MSFTNNDILGVMDKLNELNSMYGIGSTSNIRRSPILPSNVENLPNISNWTLSNFGTSRGWQIAAADARGAVSGAYHGSEIGGRWGNAGAIVGAIVGGIVVGASESIARALSDSMPQAQCLAVIESPFVYNSLPGCTNDSYPMSNAISSGMEIGTYHNVLTSFILEEYPLNNLTSINNIYDVTVDNLVDGLDSYLAQGDLEEMQNLFTENKTEMLNSWQGNIDYYLADSLHMPVEYEILKHYTYSVASAETHFDLHSYTLSYINIINSAHQAEILSDESTLLINAYISTLESSKRLWNLATPDPYVSDLFILYSSSEGWRVANGLSEYATLIANNDYDFVGFPVFLNGSLIRVYIKRDFPYNAQVASDYVTDIFNDGSFENEEGHLYYHQTIDYINDGVFQLHDVVGYGNSYKYIDFTE